jgi:hypothetical protein
MGKRRRLSREEIETRKAFYTTVGQGISNWTRVEGRLIHIAACLLGSSVEKTGAIFYSVLNFHTWLGIIDELFMLDPRFTVARNDWNKLASKLRALNDTRVRLAHHTASYVSDDEVVTKPFLKPAKEDTRSKSKAYKPLEAVQIVAFTNATNDISVNLAAMLLALRELSA